MAATGGITTADGTLHRVRAVRPVDVDLAPVGRDLRARREALGLSLDDAARVFRGRASALAKIERGANPNPTIGTLARVARALGGGSRSDSSRLASDLPSPPLPSPAPLATPRPDPARAWSFPHSTLAPCLSVPTRLRPHRLPALTSPRPQRDLSPRPSRPIAATTPGPFAARALRGHNPPVPIPSGANPLWSQSPLEPIPSGANPLWSQSPRSQSPPDPWGERPQVLLRPEHSGGRGHSPRRPPDPKRQRPHNPPEPIPCAAGGVKLRSAPAR